MNGPSSGVTFKYSFDFYEVGRGLVTVDAGFAGLAYRLPDEHHAGLVVLLLDGLKPDPVNARFGTTAWKNAAPGAQYSYQEP